MAAILLTLLVACGVVWVLYVEAERQRALERWDEQDRERFRAVWGGEWDCGRGGDENDPPRNP